MNGNLLIATGEVPEVDLTDGLIAHYLLNNNDDDATNLTTPTDTDVTYTGDFGDFNGTTSFVDTSIVLSGHVYTYSIWFKSDISTGGEDNGSLLTTGFDANSNIAINISVPQNGGTNIRASTYTGGGSSILFASFSDTGSWHNLILTKDGTTAKLYLDGVLKDDAPALDDLTSPNTIKIGRYSASSGFNGKIANVRIYDKVVSALELYTLYAEGYYPKPLPLPTTEGLLAHYPLTGTAEDKYGLGNDESGVEFNGIVYEDETAFKGDQVAVFDGTNRYAQVPSATVSSSTTTSISVWVKPNAVDILASDYIVDSANRFIISNGQGTNSSNLSFWDGSAWHFSGTDLEIGKWQHIVVISDVTSYSMYLDNILIDSGTIASNSIGLRFTIGRTWNLTNSPFDGNISNVRVYESSLTTSDIEDLYKEGLGVATTVPTTTDLVAHYKLNGDATDETGSFDCTEYSMIYNDGQRGKSITTFNGSNDYIKYTGTVSSSTNITVSMWVKVGKVNSTETDVLFMTGSGWTISNGDQGDSSNLCFRSTSGLHITGTDLTIGKWQHIVVVAEGTALTVYLDNTVIYTTTISSNSLGSDILLGLHTNLTAYPYQGDMSDVRVYEKALIASQVDTLYNEVNETTDGLVAHYPLTEDWNGGDAWVSYDGTETGAITYSDDAEFGSTVRVGAAASRYIDIPDSIVTDMATENATFTMWAKSRGTPVSTNSRLLTLISPNTNIQVGYFPNGSAYCRNGTTSQKSSASGNTLADFAHIAVTMVGGIVDSILVDNVEYAYTGSTITGAGVFSAIGSGYAGTTYYFNGDMRDVRIYNRALLSFELTDIYNYEKNFRHIDIDDGLVAYYPLANNSLDNYYNQYDGTDTSMTYDGLSGVFDGASSIINVGQNLPSFETSKVSMSCWVKPTAIGHASAVINNNIRGGGDQSTFCSGTSISISGVGHIYGQFATLTDSTVTDSNGNTYTSTFRYAMGSTPISTTEYTHCAFVIDGNTGYLYINGEIDCIVTSVDNLVFGIAGNNNYSIGALYYEAILVNSFDGSISVPRHYNKDITAEQVAAIYNTEKGDFGL